MVAYLANGVSTHGQIGICIQVLTHPEGRRLVARCVMVCARSVGVSRALVFRSMMLSVAQERDPGVRETGRMICSDRFFTDGGLCLNTVESLAALNMSNAVDKRGGKIEVDVRPKPGDPELSERVQMPSQRKACRLDPLPVAILVRRKKSDTSLVESIDNFNRTS